MLGRRAERRNGGSSSVLLAGRSPARTTRHQQQREHYPCPKTPPAQKQGNQNHYRAETKGCSSDLQTKKETRTSLAKAESGSVAQQEQP